MGIDAAQTIRGCGATVSSCNLIDHRREGFGSLCDVKDRCATSSTTPVVIADDKEHDVPSRRGAEKEDEELEAFRGYCRSFFESGLIIAAACDDGNGRVGENSAVAVDGGKAALEALNRATAALHLAAAAESAAPPPESPSVRGTHRDAAVVLRECGLHDPDTFLADGDGGRRARAYVRARDDVRRECHRASMVARRDALLALLALAERERSDDAASAASAIPRMAKVASVQASVRTIRAFVAAHRSELGSHPFLAGLRRFVEAQLEDDPPRSTNGNGGDGGGIARWTFLGAALTEASRHSGDDSCAREATRVLFSFATRVEDDDGAASDVVDVERGGGAPKEDVALVFEMDRSISDANLRRILGVLPSTRELDARPTGSIRMVETSRGYGDDGGGTGGPRINADGRFDEVWPWFESGWTACGIL